MPGPGFLVRVLAELAETFAAVEADRGVTATSVLGEVLMAFRTYEGLSRDVLPQREIQAPSMGMRAFWRAVATAAASPSSPSRLPAGLGNGAGRVEPDLQVGGSSLPDKITLREAADLLGLKSSEWVRQLIRDKKIAGWQEDGGHQRWFTSRAGVITWRDRRSGVGGTGGSPERAA